MTGVHFHLVFTHFIVACTLVGLLVLAWALFRKNHDIRTVGLSILLGAALLAVPVYLTGESAEEAAEDVGAEHAVIHEHEESAELTFIGIEVMGLAALMALLIGARRASTSRGIAIATLALGVVVEVMVVRTANLGGEIRHTEIRNGATTGERMDDDDDHDDDDDDGDDDDEGERP